MLKKSPLWTKHGCRLQCIKAQKGRPLNWLFLPGGPGLGSDYLPQLTSCLDLPGSLWLLDLPGDGSNTGTDFKNWPKALVEAVSAFDNVILVGHSSGGMFALSLPELEENLIGLVLMNSAPDNSWQSQLETLFRNNPIPHIDELNDQYLKNPSDELLEQITVSCASHFFTERGLKKGINLLKKLPYNYKSYNEAKENFDPHYKAQWVPKIPTLIVSGSEDFLTPLSLFEDFKQSNILKREIPDAGHFPWIESPRKVSSAFNELNLLLL